MAVKTFATGEILTATDTNTYLANSGLVYIGATTLNAVSNNITNVFSATYDSYRVVISNFSSATTTVRVINVRLLSGTTPNTDAQYDYCYNFAYPTNLGGNAGIANATSWEIALASTKNGQNITIDFNSPQKAHASSVIFQSMTFQNDINAYIIRQGGGGHDVATAFDGFQIYGVTDALSGTVRVYGYRQA